MYFQYLIINELIAIHEILQKLHFLALFSRKFLQIFVFFQNALYKFHINLIFYYTLINKEINLEKNINHLSISCIIYVYASL